MKSLNKAPLTEIRSNVMMKNHVNSPRHGIASKRDMEREEIRMEKSNFSVAASIKTRQIKKCTGGLSYKTA